MSLKALVELPEGASRADAIQAVREYNDVRALRVNTAGWYFWVGVLEALSDPEWFTGASDFVYVRDNWMSVRSASNLLGRALPGATMVEAK